MRLISLSLIVHLKKEKNKLLFKYAKDPNNILILSANLNPILEGNLNTENKDFKFVKNNYNKDEVKKLKKFLISLLNKSNSRIIFKLPHTSVNSPNIAKPIRCIKRVYRPTINKNCFVKGTKKINFEKEYFAFKKEFLEIESNYKNFYIWDLSSVICLEIYVIQLLKVSNFYMTNHIFFTHLQT